MPNKIIRSLSIILIILTVITTVLPQETDDASPIPPQPQSFIENGITLDLSFSELKQGTVGLARITGASIQEAKAFFASNMFPFHRYDDETWIGFILVDIYTNPRQHPLQIIARDAEDQNTLFEIPVPITNAGFAVQSFRLPGDKVRLIDSQVERNEFAILQPYLDTNTPTHLWGDAGFQLPVSSASISEFGGYRTFNEVARTRHTGWDYATVAGTPIPTVADGSVAFVGRLDIRGNYVLIDHGWGVYSGYAHLSQILVTPGQMVTQGQSLGLSGNTGRSSGPHLHWEMAVNGYWIDSEEFTNLDLPG